MMVTSKESFSAGLDTARPIDSSKVTAASPGVRCLAIPLHEAQGSIEIRMLGPSSPDVSPMGQSPDSSAAETASRFAATIAATSDWWFADEGHNGADTTLDFDVSWHLGQFQDCFSMVFPL